MSDYSVKLEGTDELLRNLAQINSNIRDEVAVKAVRAGALQILNKAKDNAPVLTGALRNSPIVTAESKRNGAEAVIAFRRKYARIQEFGGTIHAKNAKCLRFRYKGKWVMKKSVTIKGKHYLGNAIESEKGQAVTAMGAVIRSYLGK